MPTEIGQLYSRMLKAMGGNGIDLPMTAVKFYRKEDEIPGAVLNQEPLGLSLTACQAAKQASLGDSVLLTADNVGCIAAAISFGLVDKDQDEPLKGRRVYTEIMRSRWDSESEFTPPTPKHFTDGTVYACSRSGRPEFCLFGNEDSGRFKDVETARRAIADMMAIQPAVMQGVFFYSKEFEDLDIIPHVIVFSVRPVELTRMIQALQYNTGKRVVGNMGGLRSVPSDLIARPYLTGEANVSSYCLGSRLIAEFAANRVGFGMPFNTFQELAQGMEDSRTGYPFHLYPGATGR